MSHIGSNMIVTEHELTVTRQPDHDQAYKTNTGPKRLVRLMNQYKGVTPGDGQIRLNPS